MLMLGNLAIGAVHNAAEFQKNCAAIGQEARCCVIPVVSYSLIY